MRVCIVGASGKLGQYMVRQLLDRGDEVVGVCREQSVGKLDAFTPDRCMWASDWPFLRAPERIDYGPLLNLIERFVPDPVERRRVLFETPCRELGFPC